MINVCTIPFPPPATDSSLLPCINCNLLKRDERLGHPSRCWGTHWNTESKAFLFWSPDKNVCLATRRYYIFAQSLTDNAK